MNTAAEIFDFLTGIWSLTRKIESDKSLERIQCKGYGRFIISPGNSDIILYSERVTVLNPAPHTSNIGIQQYKYKYNPATSSICKYFENDDFFYQLEILNDMAYGEHICNQDKYRATYIFNNNKFSITYLVKGPEKNYTITTDYILPSPEEVPHEDKEFLV